MSHPSESDQLPVIRDAVLYWERRRIGYNLVLAGVVTAWFGFSWPHMRAALALPWLTGFIALAALANVCYCAAYVIDVPLQYSFFRRTWQRRRVILWIVGTLLATIIANYCIADEIYPFLPR